MNIAGQFVLVLACGGSMSLAAMAMEDTANPYGKIVTRNAFALKEPPVITPPPPEKPQMPSIKLQGITEMLGRKQVMFKVSTPAKPPQAATEQYKILTEGERDGEIEVLEIDGIARAIKFRNHGVEEVKTMKDDAEKPAVGNIPIASAPPVMGGITQPNPVSPVMQPAPAVGSGTSLANIGSARASGMQSIPTRNVRAQQQPQQQYGKFGPVDTAPPAPPQTPEESVIKIEIEREIHKDAISAGRYPPPPPTPLSPGSPPTPPN